MKKQLFSFLMVLALVVLAGTSAKGAAGDLPTTPLVVVAGSQQTIAVTAATASNTFSWQLYAGQNATTAVAADGGVHTVTTWPQTAATFTLQWKDQASGSYYLEVTETEIAPTTCAVTKRGFHLYILGFDVLVYTSDDAAALIDGVNLSTCGVSSSYPAFMNDLTKSVDGTNRTDGSETTADGNLADFVGTNPRASRYFTVQINFDAVPGGMAFTAPDVVSIKCDIATTASSDLYSVNGETTGASSLTQTLIANEKAANKFVFEAVYDARWGTDITTYVVVRNVKIYDDATASSVALGEEPTGREDIDKSTAFDNNISETYTIQSSPNTSTISVTKLD